MCGIAGLISSSPIDPALVTMMTDSIRHRGPDDAGLWAEDDRRVVLGQRRLAVIDLSPAGHQPMLSADGRLVIDFNGEIYNYRDIRAELEAAGKAPQWRGHSDTETLLAAFAAWGVEPTLRRAKGMFALALWDRADRTLVLARDRFGEKPLYFGDIGGMFAFGSELRALCCLPGFSAGLDRGAVRQLLGFGYIGNGRSIWTGIRQIAPGTYVRMAIGTPASEIREQAYFDYAEVVTAGAEAAIHDQVEALELLADAAGRAVSRQLVADVPVGTFLSGGIDSSLITALAARAASGRIKTFSIGFAEAGYDEAPFARAVAAHLGTDHQELYVTPAEVQAVIPELPTIYDEPFGDSSQIPTFLVSRFARGQVTVALSGDGGDELFGGYNRHRAFPALWRKAGRLPAVLRRLTLGSAGLVPPALWNHVGRIGSGHARPAFFGHKVRRTLQIASRSNSLAGLYSSFLDEWAGLPSPVVGGGEFAAPSLPGGVAVRNLPDEAQVMLGDALHYLPGDILTKVDRAAMAISLETRAPFLDPDLAALAARIPVCQKFAPGHGKAILRRLLERHVPREIFDRPKAGFAVPVGEWIKGPLRDWAEDLLSEAALADGDLLIPGPIRARWHRHLAGQEDATQALWPILMLQAWRRKP